RLIFHHLIRLPGEPNPLVAPIVAAQVGQENVAGVRFSFFLRLTRHQRFARDPLHVHSDPPKSLIYQHSLDHASSTTRTSTLGPPLTAKTGTLFAGSKSRRTVSPGNSGKPLPVVTPLAPIST